MLYIVVFVDVQFWCLSPTGPDVGEVFADAASHGLIKILSLHWSPSPVVRNVVVLFKLGFVVGVFIEGEESVSMCIWYLYGWIPCLGPSVFWGWVCWPSILSYQEPTLLIRKATQSQCRCFNHGEPISHVEGNFFGILYTMLGQPDPHVFGYTLFG